MLKFSRFKIWSKDKIGKIRPLKLILILMSSQRLTEHRWMTCLSQGKTYGRKTKFLPFILYKISFQSWVRYQTLILIRKKIQKLKVRCLRCLIWEKVKRDLNLTLNTLKINTCMSKLRDSNMNPRTKSTSYFRSLTYQATSCMMWPKLRKD